VDSEQWSVDRDQGLKRAKKGVHISKHFLRKIGLFGKRISYFSLQMGAVVAELAVAAREERSNIG
jgi:hypothetical protein